MSAAPRTYAGSIAGLARDVARGGGPLLTRDEEAALGRVARSPDSTPEERESAIKELMDRNVRLLICLARKLRLPGEDVGDLVSDGTFGLRRAAEKFDPDRGCRFSTYASPWIRQAIRRGRVAEGRDRPWVIPIHADEKFARVLRARAEAMGRGEDITFAEAAGRLGVAPAILRVGARSVAAGDCSLADSHTGHYVGDDGTPDADTFVGDWLRNLPAPPPDADRDARIRLVRTLMRRLSPRERAIVRAYHDFEAGGSSRPGPELCRRFGISRERVRQVKNHAMRKLRQWAEEAGCS